MTWGEFKATMAAAGVQDTDEIGYIDIGCWEVSAEDIHRVDIHDNKIQIEVAS